MPHLRTGIHTRTARVGTVFEPSPRNPGQLTICDTWTLDDLITHERDIRTLAGYTELAYVLDNPRMRSLTIREIRDVIARVVHDPGQLTCLTRFLGLTGAPRESYASIGKRLDISDQQAHYLFHWSIQAIRSEAMKCWDAHERGTVRR